MAEKMKNLEFQFEMVPSIPPGKLIDMDLNEKPMAYEKDEIRLREKFYYQQAYFYKGQALHYTNVSDILWENNNIDEILKNAEQ